MSEEIYENITWLIILTFMNTDEVKNNNIISKYFFNETVGEIKRGRHGSCIVYLIS